MNTKDLHPLTDDAPIEVFNPSTGMNVLITDETLPKIIKEQIQGIKDISQKVEDCTLKAQKLKEGATKLKEDGVSAFHKKDAIKALQELAKDSTELQDDFAQNQKCLFENQKQLSQALKFVFAISVTSLARTTQTIHILKAELEGASKEELSEMERQELQGLLDQLQAQEALRTKLNEHETWFAELGEKKQDKIKDLDTIRSNAKLGATAIQKHQDLSGKQDVIADLDSIRNGAKLGATAIQKHQDISGKADKSYLDAQVKVLSEKIEDLKQSLENAQSNFEKERQGHIKLKRALVTTSIGIGTISVGALIALLILIL